MWSFFSDLSSSPPGPYQQDAYVIKAEDKIKHPPILPPHLLQVLLNKDTGISVSTGLLLEYALVLVAHATLRMCYGGMHFSKIHPLSESSSVWPDASSRAQPCDAQSPVRALHQGNKSSCNVLFYCEITGKLLWSNCWDVNLNLKFNIQWPLFSVVTQTIFTYFFHYPKCCDVAQIFIAYNHTLNSFPMKSR